MAGIAVDPLRAVTTNEDFYINLALGLAFYKPKGWYFLSVKEVGELKQKITLDGESKDLEQYVWESTEEPICVIAKLDQSDELNRGKFSPGIVVWVEPKPIYDLKVLHDLPLFAYRMLKHRMNYVKDPELIGRKKPYNINGIPIVEYDWKYTLIHKELSSPLRVEAKMLFAEHGNYIYVFDFTDSLQAEENAETEFERFKSKITLM